MVWRVGVGPTHFGEITSGESLYRIFAHEGGQSFARNLSMAFSSQLVSIYLIRNVTLNFHINQTSVLLTYHGNLVKSNKLIGTLKRFIFD